MSTDWYLECLDHDPAIRSADEVEQHTWGLDPIRALIQGRPSIPNLNGDHYTFTYFERNAITFLVQHPRCRLQLVDEYDHRDPVIYEPPAADKPTALDQHAAATLDAAADELPLRDYSDSGLFSRPTSVGDIRQWLRNRAAALRRD
jgi:hypothetical protein